MAFYLAITYIGPKYGWKFDAVYSTLFSGLLKVNGTEQDLKFLSSIYFSNGKSNVLKTEKDIQNLSRKHHWMIPFV